MPEPLGINYPDEIESPYTGEMFDEDDPNFMGDDDEDEDEEDDGD